MECPRVRVRVRFRVKAAGKMLNTSGINMVLATVKRRFIVSPSQWIAVVTRDAS